MPIIEDDIPAYETFMSDLHQLLKIAAKSTSENGEYINMKPLYSELIYHRLENANGDGAANALIKALWLAKQEIVPISRKNFEIIINKVVPEQAYKNWIISISDKFEIYDRVSSQMGSKKNKFHGPNMISSKNIETYFHRKLEEQNLKLSHLVSDKKFFHNFIYNSIEVPACSDDFGTAIKNAQVIGAYIWNKRDSDELRKLEEIDVAALQSAAARLGAWAALTVGQLSQFRNFRRILRRNIKSQSKSALLFDSIIAGHDDRIQDTKSGKIRTPRNFEISHEIAQELTDDFVTEFSDEIHIIYANILNHYVRNGFGMEFIVPNFNFTIADGIKKLHEKAATPSYELVSDFKTHSLMARAFLNDGNVDKAELHRDRMAVIMKMHEFKFHTIGEAIYNKTYGLIEKQKNKHKGEKSNKYLEKAKDIHLGIGDLDGYYMVLREIEK